MYANIEIYESSILKIYNSKFDNNTWHGAVQKSEIVFAVNSRLSVQNSTFTNNRLLDLEVFAFIILASGSDVNVSGCDFTGNIINAVLDSTGSDYGPPRTYFQISNCYFDNKGDSLYFHSIADVNLQNSFIQINHNGLQFVSDMTIRIADSILNSSKTSRTQMKFYRNKLDLPQSVQLWTFNSTFTGGNQSLHSNMSNFLGEAKATNLIHVNQEISVVQMETLYASSK